MEVVPQEPREYWPGSAPSSDGVVLKPPEASWPKAVAPGTQNPEASSDLPWDLDPASVSCNVLHTFGTGGSIFKLGLLKLQSVTWPTAQSVQTADHVPKPLSTEVLSGTVKGATVYRGSFRNGGQSRLDMQQSAMRDHPIHRGLVSHFKTPTSAAKLNSTVQKKASVHQPLAPPIAAESSQRQSFCEQRQ